MFDRALANSNYSAGKVPCSTGPTGSAWG